MSEASLVRSISRLVDEFPQLVIVKTQGGPNRRGLPDLIGCYRGRSIAWEVKIPGGRPTPLQAAEIERWRKAGALSAVVTSVDEARDLLRRLERER